MIMIGHEAISMHLPAGLLAGLSQGFNEVLPVNVVQEYLLAPVASAHNVIHGSGVLNAQFARHGPLIPASRSPATKNNPNYGLTPLLFFVGPSYGSVPS